MNQFDFDPLTQRSPHRAGLGGLARRSAALVVAVVAAVLAPLSVATAAGAQDPLDCEAPVIDTSGAADLDVIDAARSRIDLSRIGPDAVVLVRVWQAVPGADLAAAVDEVVAVCVGDPASGIAADAVVIGLSVGDGFSDVLVGGAWTGVIPDANALRTEVMGPRLAEGDVTGGLVAALDEMAAGVGDLPLIVQPGPVDGEPADQPTEEVDDGDGSDSGSDAAIDSEPIPTSESDSDSGSADDDDGSPLAIALGVLALGGCGGAAILVARQRGLAQSRERLGRKVEPALGRLRVVRERHQQLLEQADVWARTSAGRTRTEIGADVREVEAAGSATDRAAGLLSRAIPNGVEGADRQQAADGQERVAELLRVLGIHREALDALAALGAHLDHLEVTLPVKAEMLADELPEVATAAKDRVDQGWSVGAVGERLTAIEAVIGEVKEAETVLEVDLLDLSDRLEAAEASLFSIDHELQHLPDMAASLDRWQQRLIEAADHELHRADELRRQLAAAALTSAAESWQWAADHPEGAIEALERADAVREHSVGQLVPAQRFDEAGRALDQAGLEIMVADELLDQLDDLLVDLERARAEAPGVADQVEHSLVMLEAAIDRHRADLSPEVLHRRDELVQVVAGLRSELARPKPNHIRVVESGEETNRVVDELLIEIDEQHQRAEALRRELGRQRLRADRALARARRALGWQLFPSADGAALDRLEARLASLPNDLTAAVDAAADIADAALAMQEQIIARRRRRSAGVTIGTGSSSGGRGWSMGGSARRSAHTRSRPGSRSSGGRSFGGRRRSSGGRSTGSRRSTGRF